MSPAADSTFLLYVSDAVFELGQHGIELTSLTLNPRGCRFADPGRHPAPPRYAGDPPPEGHEERRATYWQPAAAAPPWLQLAWLVNELGNGGMQEMADAGLTLTGLDSPGEEWADVQLEFAGHPYRARIALTGRDDPIEFPGMYLRGLFTEGRHPEFVKPFLTEAEPVVDLRDAY